MSDLPSSALAQQAHATPMTGEQLEVMGKHASKRYLNGECHLTEAVMETVKHAGLSPEQVRRVVEFANTDAFLQEFRKEGRQHRVVEFEGGPADYAAILQELNGGGGGTVFDKHANDYNYPPTDAARLESRNQDRLGVEETKLAEAFAVQGQEIPFEDPLREAYDARAKLAGAQEELISEIGMLEGHYLDVVERLFGNVKQASYEGATLGQIVGAWGQVTDNPDFVKAAFQQLTPRLLQNGVFSSKADIGDSLMKTASVGVLNKEHPLLSDFHEYCSVLSKLAEDRAAQQEVETHLSVLTGFLKEAGLFDLAKKTPGLIPRVLEKAEQASVHAGKGGKAVGEALFGSGSKGAKNTEALARGAVKYAPHVVGGLAAESAYQHARYNPAVRAATNFALSRVPYTHPYMVRQYNMQMQ